MIASYQDRKNRGIVRAVYNEGVAKINGNQNKKGSFFVNTDELENLSYSGKQVEPYSFLNLTSDARVDGLHQQFEIV